MSDHTTEELIACMIRERLRYHPRENWTGQEPNFSGIAMELTYLERLTEQGWWGDYSYCMYAEEVLRQFGPVVAKAAVVEATGRGEGDVEVLMERMVDFLSWLECMHGDNIELGKAIRATRKGLSDIIDGLRAKRVAERKEQIAAE